MKSKSKKSLPKKTLVVKFHSMLCDGSNGFGDIARFYSEAGQGWVTDIESATRYRPGGADCIMLALLQDEKIATVLIDIKEKPENIFTLHTVFLDEKNIPQVIVKVPQFLGDFYYLVPSYESWKEEDLVDVLKEDRFTALYDTNIGVVPRSNEEFLASLGYEFED